MVDSAAEFIDRGAAESYDVKSAEHCDGVFELIIDGTLVAVERVVGSLVWEHSGTKSAGPRGWTGPRVLCPQTNCDQQPSGRLATEACTARRHQGTHCRPPY